MKMASKQVLPDQSLHSVSTECGGRPYDNNRLGRKYEARLTQHFLNSGLRIEKSMDTNVL